MTDKINKNKLETEQLSEKTIGRRELLKALVATGGAVTAASVVPGKWSKPVVEAGVLPAHAQTSQLGLVVRVVSAGNAFSNVTTTGENGSDPTELVIEAEVTPNQSGIDITADPSAGSSQTDTTNAGGIATFTFFACDFVGVTGNGGISFSIDFAFSDPATYGSASETVSGEVNPAFCEG